MTDSIPTYAALLDALRCIQDEGRLATGRTREQRRAHLYWDMGDAIQRHLVANQGRQHYGEQVMERLAADLELTRSLLYLILQFRQSLSKVDAYRQLAWSHFRVLLPCRSQAERDFYARAADDRGWSVRELKDAVAADLYGQARERGSAVLDTDTGIPLPPLRPRRGRLYTYRLVAPGGTRGVPPDRPVVDLGFDQRWPGQLSGLPDPRPGQIVASEWVDGAYRFAPVTASNRHLFTFPAGLDRVVDGDTLIATIDCGFERHISQRLRLRGIDAAELYSRAGQRARDALADLLAGSPTLIVATRSSDVYGRYLADLFCLKGEADPARVLSEGIYVNNEMLRLDSVRRYPE